MTDFVDSRVIKKTQEILGKVIKKPPLNEKLLKKPPFRFLHDVITNIIKTTKFFDGLYTPEEMVSENVKDKEKKIAFLQKAIDVTIMVTGENLTVKPTKIVSGHEPEKTNELLQAIGKAIVNKKDSSEAVQKVLNGEKPALPTGNKKKGPSDQLEKSRRKEPVNRESKSRSKANESKLKTSVRNNVSDQNKTRDRNKAKEREASKERSKNKTQEPVVEQKKVSSPSRNEIANEENTEEHLEHINENSQIIVNGDIKSELKLESPSKSSIDKDLNKTTEEDNLIMQKSENASEVISSPKSVTRPSTAIRMPSARKKMSHSAEPSNSEQVSKNLPQQIDANEPQVATTSSSRAMSAAPKSARPSSARPAPPKIRIRHIVENEEQIRLPSAKPVANVILDTQDTSDNEDETFITEEAPELPIENQKELTVPSVPVEDEQQGSLVKQLLETKKDLEGGSQQIPSRKTEIDKSQMTDVARRRERESTSKELEQLRSFIQTVSRSANPLGKILDYLQEDIDSMQQELKMWQEEHRQNLVALHREESVTENVLDPLRAQLEELEQTVQDQLDNISTLKSSILRNDERIHRMLAAVNQTHGSEDTDILQIF